jgi:hypothetical protein
MFALVKYLWVSFPRASMAGSIGPRMPTMRASRVANESFWKRTWHNKRWHFSETSFRREQDTTLSCTTLLTGGGSGRRTLHCSQQVSPCSAWTKRPNSAHLLCNLSKKASLHYHNLLQKNAMRTSSELLGIHPHFQTSKLVASRSSGPLPMKQCIAPFSLAIPPPLTVAKLGIFS